MTKILPAALVALLLSACGTPTDTAVEAPAADEQSPPTPATASESDITLTQERLLVDTHIDVPYRLHDEFEDVSVTTPGGDFDYPRAAAGGLDSMFMSIYIPADVDARGEATEFADGLIDLVETVSYTHLRFILRSE